jgi:hypothetical protein
VHCGVVDGCPRQLQLELEAPSRNRTIDLKSEAESNGGDRSEVTQDKHPARPARSQTPQTVQILSYSMALAGSGYASTRWKSAMKLDLPELAIRRRVPGLDFVVWALSLVDECLDGDLSLVRANLVAYKPP